jgi:hypothetical protein
VLVGSVNFNCLPDFSGQRQARAIKVMALFQRPVPAAHCERANVSVDVNFTLISKKKLFRYARRSS